MAPGRRRAYFLSRMSAIAKLVKKLEGMERRARQLAQKEVVVGWANDAREKPRSASVKADTGANVGKKGRKVKKGASTTAFDENFVGPGGLGASLATIAKTLCYGREGGRTKSGREYGRIPARNFVRVLGEKHSRLIHRAVADQVIKKGADGNVDMVFIADKAKGQLQRAIKDSNEYAPNSAFTKLGGWMANPVNKKPFYAEPKKSERPLIDTGTLVNSVSFEIKSR